MNCFFGLMNERLIGRILFGLMGFGIDASLDRFVIRLRVVCWIGGWVGG